jgi:hypothetical protein
MTTAPRPLATSIILCSKILTFSKIAFNFFLKIFFFLLLRIVYNIGAIQVWSSDCRFPADVLRLGRIRLHTHVSAYSCTAKISCRGSSAKNARRHRASLSSEGENNILYSFEDVDKVWRSGCRIQIKCWDMCR